MITPTAAANQALQAQKTRLADLVASTAAAGGRSVFAGIQRTDDGLKQILTAWVLGLGYTYDTNTDRICW